MAYLDGPKPRVIAHRGLALDAPENTLAAFQAASLVGADILETDVHLSKDGQVVLAHDPDLRRLTGRAGMVSDYTAAQLADIDLGGGHGFALLVEALQLLPGARFNIDLKEPAVIDAFVDVITQMKAHERVLIASFDEKTRKTATEKLPGVPSSATPPHVLEGKLRSWLGLPADSWQVPPTMVALQVPTTRFGLSLVTPSLIRTAHTKGLEVHVWTIDDAPTMNRLWDMGVDGIVTDHSDVAVAARMARGANVNNRRE
jgi:glycerophosphoryl diester phosphodiesterase